MKYKPARSGDNPILQGGFMPIPYALLTNYLTTDPDDCFALIRPIGVLSEEDIIKRMLRRGTTMEEADIRGALQLFTSEVEMALLEGYTVHTGLTNFGSRILGVFDGRDDQFSDDRHTLLPRVNPGKELRQAFRDQAHTTKQERSKPQPAPLSLEDVTTGEINSAITPGGMAVLMGHRLRFKAEEEAEGIFIVSEDGSAVKAGAVAINKPGRLVFMIPADLAGGEYSLEVRASQPGGSDVRTGILDETLYAAA